jgi:hypothetical protein
VTCADKSTKFGHSPTYSHRDAACDRRADPIDLLFPENAPTTIEEVLRGAIDPNTNRHWKDPGVFAGDQWICVEGVERRQVVQLAAGRLWQRFHVRLWDNQGAGRARTVGSAHHEHGFTFGVGWNGLHYPDSFDSGRNAVSETLALRGASVMKATVDLTPMQNLPTYSSGQATVVKL